MKNEPFYAGSWWRRWLEEVKRKIEESKEYIIRHLPVLRKPFRQNIRVTGYPSFPYSKSLRVHGIPPKLAEILDILLEDHSEEEYEESRRELQRSIERLKREGVV